MQHCYQYWDNFINDWYCFMKHGGNTIADWNRSSHQSHWQYPCCVYNTIKKGDKSIKYLPEPWWGYSGSPTDELHSVVINYNPGEGGNVQQYDELPTPMFYRQFINQQANFYLNKDTRAWKTNEWHDSHRAQPIFNALKALGVCTTGSLNLKNHLSIELVPWHTKKWVFVSQYAHLNVTSIFEHSIMFAAKASRHIANSRLKNRVIVRISYSVFMELFGNTYNIQTSTMPTDIAPTGAKLAHSKYAKLNILNQGIDDVEFLLIWQPKARSNNLPSFTELKEII